MSESQAFCHFYIVRHAQSEGNVRNIIQGHADYPLTELGKKQAAERAKQLQHITFHDCFSSDLMRAHQTADILASFHQLVVQTTEVLREQNFGKYNGVDGDWYERELEHVLTAHRRLAQKERFFHHVTPDIESDEEMMGRLLTFLRATALLNIQKNILVVTHGSMIRTLLVHLGFADFEQLKYTAVGNCAYLQLDCDGVDFFIRSTEGIEIQARKTSPSTL